MELRVVPNKARIPTNYRCGRLPQTDDWVVGSNRACGPAPPEQIVEYLFSRIALNGAGQRTAASSWANSGGPAVQNPGHPPVQALDRRGSPGRISCPPPKPAESTEWEIAPHPPSGRS